MQNKHSLSWTNPGTFRKTFSGASRWPALSTQLGQMQVTWMIWDTVFSLRRMERLSRTSYHLAKIAFENTPCGQTIKRVLGDAVCSVTHQSSTQSDSDGRWEAQRKTNQVWQLTGWLESLLPSQCWSFLHAEVPDRAVFQTVFACRTS